MKTVNFIAMEDGTAEEYALLDRYEYQYKAGLSERLIDAVLRLENSLKGYKVTVLEHSLQSATRAYRAGESEEWVVAALLHDIGDDLAVYSHSELVAAILKPFVSEEVYWVVKHHGIFQMYYYAHHRGSDQNARDRYKDNPHYDATVRFCHEYDQNCFDPEYPSEPIDFFRPMMERVFAEPRHGYEEMETAYCE